MGLSAPPALSPEAFEEAAELLEAHTSHRGTLALHDPLFALSRVGATEEVRRAAAEELAGAVAAWPDHPALPELRRLLGPELLGRPEGLAAVLARHGLDPSTPAASVDRELGRLTEVRRVLEARIEALEVSLAQARALANALALVGAVLAVFGLLGWLVGLGGLELPWVESPSVEDKAMAPSSR